MGGPPELKPPTMIETFPIIPGQIRFLWIAVPIVLLVLAAMGALIYSLSSARNSRFDVSSEGLRIHGDLYGRLIPARSLRLDSARAVDLSTDGSLAPRFRTVGTAIPGYRAGWFRLRDGERALLYVTDPTHVAYVPTTDGYAVLMSVADPEALLASLRRIAPPA
jgi:Bacterial PH domain